MNWTAAGPSRVPDAGATASQCEVCRRFGGARVCADCLARHAPPRWRCQRCALPVPVGQPTCGDCLRHPPAWDRAVSAFDYAFPWDGLIAQFKFHARTDVSGPLARCLAGAVVGAGAAAVDLVVPVPLGSRRLAQRGFNFHYLGMIGSRTKVAKAFQQLRDRGISDEVIRKICSPVGISIGATTPAEIAISIAAELVAVRNGAQAASCTLSQAPAATAHKAT